jgi:hypothetical protein
LLARLVADTHEALEQKIMAYIAAMRCVRGDGAMSYTTLANCRVRGNMVTSMAGDDVCSQTLSG